MYNSGFSYDGHRVITCDALTETGLIRHGFSTRKGGISTGKFASLNLGISTEDDRDAVRQNFTLYCRDARVEPKHLVALKQIHSTKVIPVTKKDAGKVFANSEFFEADGLLTNDHGVCLTTFYADCTPFLLFDHVKQVVGAVHSGWRGTLGQIVCRAVETMVQYYGSDSRNILVASGPSIKQCHFEVGQDVYELFLKQFGKVTEENTQQKGEKFYIDTDAINAYFLQKAGVSPQNIYVHPDCSHCHAERYFSYRRDGETGRMCAMIELI